VQTGAVMAEHPTSMTALAAFAALIRHHGIDTTAETIQRRYVFGDEEAEHPPLVAIAVDMGLEARWMTLRLAQLPKLRNVLPVLLRLNDGGAIILEAVTDSAGAGLIAHVSDPLSGDEARAVLDQGQIGSIWSGDVLLVKRAMLADDIDQPFGIEWLTNQVLRERQILRDIGIASLIGTVFALTPPFIVMIVIDRVLINHSVSTLWVIATILLTLIIFEMVLGYLRRLFMELTATRIDGRLQLYVMTRLLRLPMDYFETNPVGITSAKINQIWFIRGFLTGQLFTTVLDMVTLVGLIPALFILEWRLALWVIAMAVMVFGVVMSFIKPLARLYAKVVKAEQVKGSYLIETIHGMKTIKSLALEARRRRGWDQRVAVSVAARHAWGAESNYPQTFVLPFQRLMYSGSILIGAALALMPNSDMHAGVLVAFGMIAMRAGQPLVQLAKLLENVGEVRGAIHEVASVMNVTPEEARGESGLRLPIRGEIRFDDVRFRYAPGSSYALSGASFEIRAGTIFGIMGRSGSGKTTITRLLQGLNKGYEGAIKIDGMDLREIDLHHLRTSIGVVPQENFLFSGTVRENIGMARASATFPQIVRAAQLAGAEEFIEKMPRGYDTVLQEGATNLSGGQRQRLALARALLIDPPVLILDEATSALDAESEAIINANLVRIARDRTIICVSHRLAMLVPCDAILVMEQGKAYDIGRHEELLHRCDIYKHMWHQQNKHLETGPYARPVLARA
jgi:subfamily B ATP-binding cassette protein HlyB/CyaB